jgi:hypothetical protein
MTHQRTGSGGILSQKNEFINSRKGAGSTMQCKDKDDKCEDNAGVSGGVRYLWRKYPGTSDEHW